MGLTLIDGVFMGKQTPLHSSHLELGARITDFNGWDMPLHYGSQIREHHAVRKNCGVFDVSHMGVVDVEGTGARDFLQHLLANDVGRLTRPGMAQYSLMLNHWGGIVDDLIVSRVGESAYRLVVNAGTRQKDLEWMGHAAAGREVVVRERSDLAMVAVQGPDSPHLLEKALAGDSWERIGQLPPFGVVVQGETFVSRTGYTGEMGFEVILPAAAVVALWNRLLDNGVLPAGLGARDTLRLEAGLNLYGGDMDEETTPFESGLSWTVAWDPSDRNFAGREILEPMRHASPSRRRVGIVLQEKGVLRNHQTIMFRDKAVGEITSGSYSPTLETGIGLAKLDQRVKLGDVCQVEMRGRNLPALVVKPPFVRHGNPTFCAVGGV